MKITTKFELNQVVWAVLHGMVEDLTIKSIVISNDGVQYCFFETREMLYEDEIFAKKEEALVWEND